MVISPPNEWPMMIGGSEPADDGVVVVGDFGDAEPLVGSGIAAELLDRLIQSGPGRGEHAVALAFEALDPVLQLSGVNQSP